MSQYVNTDITYYVYVSLNIGGEVNGIPQHLKWLENSETVCI